MHPLPAGICFDETEFNSNEVIFHMRLTLFFAFFAVLFSMGNAPGALAQSSQDLGHNGMMIEDPWARATAGSAKNGAAYITIVNNGENGDKLVSVQTDIAKSAELHTHIMENDVAKMREVESIEVPAGATVVLKPGGDHLMLMGLFEPLEEGNPFQVLLTFENAGEIPVEVPVKGVGAMESGATGSGDGDHDHGHSHDHDHDHEGEQSN